MPQLNVLPVETQAKLGCTHEYIVEFDDFTSTGNTQTFTVTIPAGSLVKGGPHVLETDFTDSGGGITSLAYTVGDGDDADIYLSSTEVETSGTEIDYKVATNTGIANGKVYTSADTIDFAFTATAAQDLTTLTGGKLRYYFSMVDLDDLKKS